MDKQNVRFNLSICQPPTILNWPFSLPYSSVEIRWMLIPSRVARLRNSKISSVFQRYFIGGPESQKVPHLWRFEAHELDCISDEFFYSPLPFNFTLSRNDSTRVSAWIIWQLDACYGSKVISEWDGYFYSIVFGDNVTFQLRSTIANYIFSSRIHNSILQLPSTMIHWLFHIFLWGFFV